VRALALIAACALSGCVAYNDPCQPLVDDPNKRIAYLTQEVWNDKPNTRHTNNALGQAAADAFVDVFKDSSSPADFGVINGGSLRAEGLCVTRNILPKGGLTNGTLYEILLFANLMNAVTLTEDETWAMFEHSVEKLYTAPDPIAAPAGQFLQVSKSVQLTVDCTHAPGSRITSLSIGGTALQHPGRPAQTFRAALSSYLLGGGDDYAMLVAPGTDPSRDPEQAQRLGGLDVNITSDYLERTDNGSQADGLQLDSSRVTLTNCSVPVRPASAN
jgi:2',3'-cyclic-nucleotide 2'-phosphodiesterase (5'-nucleotidase family)